MQHHFISVRSYFAILMALLGLTALTVWVAYQDLGRMNNVAAMGIASVKASLVIWYFMHVKFSTRFTKIAILIGLFFMLLLFAFTLGDVYSRGALGVPGK